MHAAWLRCRPSSPSPPPSLPALTHRLAHCPCSWCHLPACQAFACLARGDPPAHPCRCGAAPDAACLLRSSRLYLALGTAPYRLPPPPSPSPRVDLATDPTAAPLTSSTTPPCSFPPLRASTISPTSMPVPLCCQPMHCLQPPLMRPSRQHRHQRGQIFFIYFILKFTMAFVSHVVVNLTAT